MEARQEGFGKRAQRASRARRAWSVQCGPDGTAETLTAAFTVAVYPSMRVWLERASGRERRSVGAIVRDAIEAYRRSHPDGE